MELGELFLESFGFSKGACCLFAAAQEAASRAPASGGEGLTPPLHPRKGHSPLDPFFRSVVT